MKANKNRIGIIGGGAAGLISAVLLARQGYAVTILEKNDKIGKKLLVTGNGRCNISNRKATEKYYFSRTKNLSAAILKRFPVDAVLEFFESIGITVKELEKGKLYPYSLEAKTVVKAFLYELEYLGVEVLYHANVTKIAKNQDWTVTYEQKPEESGKAQAGDKGGKSSAAKPQIRQRSFDRLILCTGGTSYSSSGSDGSGYRLAKALGHSIVEPAPAIVQLVMNEKTFPYYKHLSGTKTEAVLKLINRETGEVLREEAEELLFTAYGISGPAVLLLSTNTAYALAKKQKLEVAVNFFPEMTAEELLDFIMDKVEKIPHFTIEHLLEMMIPNRLISVLLKKTGVTPMTLAEDLPMPDLKNIIRFLTALRLEVVSPYQWQQAQVTAGGISCLEVNPETLESGKAKDLYFAGEVLDMDGDCGGFNLQWAWSSAMAVVEAIKQRG